MIICNICKEEKGEENFYRKRKSHDRRCKKCLRKRFNVYNEEHKYDPNSHSYQFKKLKEGLKSRVKYILKFHDLTFNEVLGCNISELKTHLECQFKDNMNWNNRGRMGWHIDHIKPLAHMDIKNVEDVKEYLHYTNLQPLWQKDNIKKSNSLEWFQNYY